MALITAQRPTNVIVVNRNTVLSIEENRPVLTTPPASAQIGTVVETRTVVSAVSSGPQGPKGDAGLSGAGLLPPINFAFGDATPAPLLTLPANSEIVGVSLEIVEGFDGAGVQLQLGTTAAPGSLIAAGDTDPGVEGAVFEFSPRVEIAAGIAIILTIEPGTGATRGRGQLIITSVPTT